MHSKTTIKALLLSASSMTVMAGAIISPALPDIDAHFPEQSDVMIKLVLTMPALMITLFATVMGMLADYMGRVRLLCGALLLYGTAGSAGFLVDSFTLLLLSRAGLGIAVAGIMSISTTLIGDYFEGDERTKFLGTQASFMALGGIVFLNLGGLLAEWSWRGPFAVYLAGLVLAPLCWKILYEPASQKENEDQIADTSGNGEPWKITLAYCLGFLGMLMFYMVPAQLPFLMNLEYQASSFVIGLSVSIVTFCAAIVSFNYGKARKHCSIMSLYILAHLLAAAGFTLVGLSQSYILLLLGLAISGIGFGFVIPNGNVWLMTLASPRHRGRIIGGFSSIIFLGQFLSPVLVAPLQLGLDSLRLVFVVVGVASLVLALLLLPIIKKA